MPLSHVKSEAHFARAQKVIPGGVNSPARAFGGVGGTPVIIDRADGPYLYDIDGNRYLDYIGSWGPHILGHRHPQIMDAIQASLQKGTSYGAPCESETVLAELVIAAVPSIEKVRMVNSGTEATMSAIRVARGFTGRNVIIKFAGCYHGHVDSLLVQAGSGALTHGVPSSPGVPAGCTADTLSLPYNDCQQLEDTFSRRGGEIAAVILEPVVGNMGVVIPTPEFLQTLQRVCRQHGAVLIFDEVMTGFRLAFGGAQERFGIRPDMTTLGKILGGGMPVGAYGGRTDIMNSVSPVGPVYQAGTLSGNPVAMAAGIAMLTALKELNPYPALETFTARLCVGLSALAGKYGLPHTIPQIGSMFTLFFNPEVVTSYDVAKHSDTKRFARYFHAMLDGGVYLACSQYEANFVSAALTEEHLQATLQAADRALEQIARS
ncbi:glutamate-1-semialdehyde 2,1-aminomutase [Planctellipticum variicoloris]|uniref:glutamate-1-semialdehyde 2,1-aminomutase n=1 Tax=Planctellipticum variicoloris TaxID=3064265 RepID=UPI0030136717|nr:glutamate-1-semialdehyde 2,1-aminomutase [Planctomycetaceae bacterium SH412]